MRGGFKSSHCLHSKTSNTAITESALRHSKYYSLVYVGGRGLPQNISAASCLTIIRSHEGNIVDVVLDVGRLSVKDGNSGNPPVDGVNLQPIGRVVHLGVPGFSQKETALEATTESLLYLLPWMQAKQVQHSWYTEAAALS